MWGIPPPPPPSVTVCTGVESTLLGTSSQTEGILNVPYYHSLQEASTSCWSPVHQWWSFQVMLFDNFLPKLDKCHNFAPHIVCFKTSTELQRISPEELCVKRQMSEWDPARPQVKTPENVRMSRCENKAGDPDSPWATGTCWCHFRAIETFMGKKNKKSHLPAAPPLAWIFCVVNSIAGQHVWPLCVGKANSGESPTRFWRHSLEFTSENINT